MKSVVRSLTVVAALALAAPAFAQDNSSGASTDTMAQPSGKSKGQYQGVDTAGKRENVKAPYGGHNQSQADRKEMPITENLNEMALKNAQPH